MKNLLKKLRSWRDKKELQFLNWVSSEKKTDPVDEYYESIFGEMRFKYPNQVHNGRVFPKQTNDIIARQEFLNQNKS